MLIRLDRRRVRLFLGWLAGAALLLMAGTAAHWLYGRRGAPAEIAAFLHEFDLTMENVVASWFSSMLLLLGALAALLCHAGARGEAAGGGSRLRGGWLALAAAFLLLSFDEAASIHERLARSAAVLDSAIRLWPVLLAIPAYFLAFGWHQLRRSPRAFAMLAAGVALLASVPVQEYVEDVTWEQPGQPLRPVPMILLEEGAELAGGLLCLGAFLLYAARIAQRRARWLAGRPGLIVPLRLPSSRTTGLALLVLAPFYAVSFLLTDPDPNLGTASNWPPAALALVGSLLALRAGRPLAAAVCLLVSGFVGAELFLATGPWHPLRLLAMAAAAGASLRGAATAPPARRPLYLLWGAGALAAFAARGAVLAGTAATVGQLALLAALLLRMRIRASAPGLDSAAAMEGPRAIGAGWGAAGEEWAPARETRPRPRVRR